MNNNKVHVEIYNRKTYLTRKHMLNPSGHFTHEVIEEFIPVLGLPVNSKTISALCETMCSLNEFAPIELHQRLCTIPGVSDRVLLEHACWALREAERMIQPSLPQSIADTIDQYARGEISSAELTTAKAVYSEHIEHLVALKTIVSWAASTSRSSTVAHNTVQAFARAVVVISGGYVEDVFFSACLALAKLIENAKATPISKFPRRRFRGPRRVLRW